MTAHYSGDTISEVLPLILSDLTRSTYDVGSRNGRTSEFVNTRIVLKKPWRREVLNPNRGANIYAQIAETVWVLSGRNDIEWLTAYLPRAVDYSDDGETWQGGYGPRIRKWVRRDGDVFDQLNYVLETLCEDHTSRRAVISLYDPEIDSRSHNKDIPCNDFLQFISRGGYLHLTATLRSNDVMWGWSGINAFEWSVLQEVVASLLGLRVGDLTFNVGSFHLYERHWAKARRVGRVDEWTNENVAFNSNRLIRNLNQFDNLMAEWFKWEALCREGKATLEDLQIEEPLFRAWAMAIAYYWQRDDVWLSGIRGTTLATAMLLTPASLLPAPRQTPRSAGVAPNHPQYLHDRVRAFYGFATELHRVKHESYGDSWKKRGEVMSILANMARKVDRLGVTDEFETAADTIVDLFIYTLKYKCWLENKSDGPDNVGYYMSYYLGATENIDTNTMKPAEREIKIRHIAGSFNQYCESVRNLGLDTKLDWVSNLAMELAPLARDAWDGEQC